MRKIRVKLVKGEPKFKLFGAPCASLGPEFRFWLNIDGLDVMVSTAKFATSDDAVRAGLELLKPLNMEAAGRVHKVAWPPKTAKGGKP